MCHHTVYACGWSNFLEVVNMVLFIAKYSERIVKPQLTGWFIPLNQLRLLKRMHPLSWSISTWILSVLASYYCHPSGLFFRSTLFTEVIRAGHVIISRHVSFTMCSLHTKCKQLLKLLLSNTRLSWLIKTYCFRAGRVWGCDGVMWYQNKVAVYFI